MSYFKHIEINIGKACNNKCRFCMSSNVGYKESQLTDFKFVKEEILLYSNKGYNSIGFLGGDISIHPNIYEIIDESKKNGFENINIITNGMIFENYEKSEKLIDSGVTRVNLSIHSHIDEIEDYLTQVRGGLKRKLYAIDNFLKLYNKNKLKNQLNINIVLNKLNYKSIFETCIYFYKVKNIKDIRINFLWSRFFFSVEDKDNLELMYSDFLPFLKKLIIFSLKSDLRITFDTFPICIFNLLGLSNNELLIKKFLGEDMDYINEISNINVGKVFNWKEQKKNELKLKFEKCNKCLYFNQCQGVWKEYAEKYGENEFIPIL